jgi:zinc protease
VKALLFESSHALPLISVALTFRGGRIHEPDGVDGVARITGRMLRRGCDGMNAEAIERRIDVLGGELGAHVGLGSSSISFEVLARNIEPMVELTAALLAKPTFDEEELARLLRQAEAELVRSRDSDGLLAGRALRRHMLGEHPHGKRVGGSIDGLRAIDRGVVERFHKQHYCRGEAIVSICGSVDRAHAERIAEQLLSALPEGEPVGYPADDPVSPSGRRLVIVDKADRSQAQMAIGTLGTHPKDDDHTALLVANTAFGGTFTARLVQEVRAKRGWSYGASSVLSTSQIRESFSMWTAPAATDAAACLALQLQMLDKWVDDGIDDDELQFCKDCLRRSYAFEVDTAKKRVQQLLERALFDLPADFHTGYVDRVQAVTLDQANASIKKRISPNDLWISVVATEADIGEQLRAAVPQLEECVVDRYDVE